MAMRLDTPEYKEALKQASTSGRQSRYKMTREEGKLKVYMADFNDFALLNEKDASFQHQLRALGVMLDAKLKLKNQHKSRIWSAYMKFANI